MKNVLVIGATGLLGRAVLKELTQLSTVNVLGTGLSRAKQPPANIRNLDVTASEEQVVAFLQEIKPDVIIYSAAIRNVETCTKQYEFSKQVNVDGLEKVCKYASRTGSWVLYYSTDYVFDGTKPPYLPSDSPNPLNVYGKLKAEGEQVAKRFDFPVLRVPILYGQVESLEESAVTVIFKQLMSMKGETSICHHQRRYPTHCDTVARVTQQLVEKHLEGDPVRGTFHWSESRLLTKYQMAVIMCQQMGLPSDLLRPNDGPPPGDPRPHDAQLDCSSLIDLIGKQTELNFDEAIKCCLTPFHK